MFLQLSYSQLRDLLLSKIFLREETHMAFNLTYLLFKIASLLLIDENQVEVVPHGELLVNVPHGGRHLIAR